MRIILLLTILLALTASIDARLRVSKGKMIRSRKAIATTKVCGSGWGSFTQWDAAWKAKKMGSKTIGAVGCAMTSVCNALKSRIAKITVGGTEVDLTPDTLNDYLKEHGGYDNNAIYWGKVNALGTVVSMIHRSSAALLPSYDELKAEVEKCNAVIANVNGGGHWVLLTGVVAPDKFNIMDPGFGKTEESYSGIKRVIIYDFVEKPAEQGKVEKEAEAQGAPAAEAAAVAAPAVPVDTPAAVSEPQAAQEAATDGAVAEEIALPPELIAELKAKNGGDFGGEDPAVAGGGAPPVAAEAVAAAAPPSAANGAPPMGF
jgi:hypothetical protein